MPLSSFTPRATAGTTNHRAFFRRNPLLQLLYFNVPLRATMLNRLSAEEVSLSDELHFLFNMMDEQSAVVCFPSNFIRAFRQLRPHKDLVATEEGEGHIDNQTMARPAATRV